MYVGMRSTILLELSIFVMLVFRGCSYQLKLEPSGFFTREAHTAAAASTARAVGSRQMYGA
jgi:hypothetical protein